MRGSLVRPSRTHRRCLQMERSLDEPKAHLFISYSRKDSEVVRWVASRLEAAGYTSGWTVRSFWGALRGKGSFHVRSEMPRPCSSCSLPTPSPLSGCAGSSSTRSGNESASSRSSLNRLSPRRRCRSTSQDPDRGLVESPSQGFRGIARGAGRTARACRAGPWLTGSSGLAGKHPLDLRASPDHADSPFR